jgi:hypothetical protein
MFYDEVDEKFDWISYIDNNDDLKNAGINNEESALNHWITYGKNESRVFYNKDGEYENFDWINYIKKYDDLRMSNIFLKQAAWNHWKYNGKYEQRDHSQDEKDYFDFRYYLHLNIDVFHSGLNTRDAAFYHWINYGKNEGRRYGTFKKIYFDWVYYTNKYTDLLENNINTEELAYNHWIYNGIHENRFCFDFSTIFSSYPNLFHKYILNISHHEEMIPYLSIIDNKLYKKNEKFICHLHILDISNFNDIYGNYIQFLQNHFKIIITYSNGELNDNILQNNNYIILKIKNKGYDIGGKICAVNYLNKNKIEYQYILFLHSKTNVDSRKKYFEPLIKNENRIKLIKQIFELNENLLGIFPNIMWNMNENYGKIYGTLNYYNEILKFLNIDLNINDIFCEGNCFIVKKCVVDYIFINKINLFYNLLNEDNSFDLNWFRLFYGKDDTIENLYQYYKENNLHGNNSLLKNANYSNNLSDGMVEHVFERVWIDIIKHLGGDYLTLDKDNIIDTYNIKLNAIYFPQFHEIEENNNFWGKGFTEWTLLKPFDDTISVDNIKYPILKPHSDIGYYDLSYKETLLKQIDIAKKYNVNGFIIYHYWFDNNKKILYKPLEYFLDDDIDFPFCISWANESWTKRWDGYNHDVLLEQRYDSDNFFLNHIQYLIPFFKKRNYIKNEHGENIFYIYHYTNLINHYDTMINIWKNELENHGLKIKVIITENSFKENCNIPNTNLDKFIFEPMYFNNYGNNYNDNNYTKIDYQALIDKYKLNLIDTKNKHLGLSLHWNNIIRRKNSNFTYIKNFSNKKLQELLFVYLAIIALRYKNLNRESNIENFININAWNEWNEQAVLEPNDKTGYSNLDSIYSIIKDI